MDIAVFIMSCAATGNRRQSMRDTWLKDLPPNVPHRFFLGQHDNYSFVVDETMLPCLDDYQHCSDKQRMMLEAARDGYDYVFFCDDDTYVVVDRLLDLDYIAQHDYIGCPCPIEDGVMMAHGGAGFWLSQKAIREGLAQESPETIYSDRLVGHLMHRAGIKLHADFRFNLGKYVGDKGYANLLPNKANAYVSAHFVKPHQFTYLYEHFHRGIPGLPNSYPMNFFGKRVDFSERAGRWWYIVIGETSWRGEFTLAQDAEQDAFNYLQATL